MLTTSAARLPEGEHWSYEVKWDGYRTLAVKDGARVTLLSRNLKDATGQYSTAVRAVAEIRETSALLDGEIVAIDEQRSSSRLHHTVHTIRSTHRTHYIWGRHILNSAARDDDRASPADKGRHGNPDEVLEWSLVHSPRIETTEPERASNHRRSMSRLQT
jgi:hypothetical protein